MTLLNLIACRVGRDGNGRAARPASSLRLPTSGFRLPTSPHAFTLIELLVVITIIAILAAASATVASSVLTQARAKRAAAVAFDLSNAWANYEVAFDDWPVPDGAATQTASDERGQEWEFMPATEKNLEMLTGANDLKLKFVTANLTHSELEGALCYLDPWRVPYRLYFRNPMGGQAPTDPEEQYAVRITFPNRDRYFQ